jgi:hypothetical protein
MVGGDIDHVAQVAQRAGGGYILRSASGPVMQDASVFQRFRGQLAGDRELVNCICGIHRFTFLLKFYAKVGVWEVDGE